MISARFDHDTRDVRLEYARIMRQLRAMGCPDRGAPKAALLYRQLAALRRRARDLQQQGRA